MSWVYYNPNPLGNLVGDCTIRALTLALNKDWDKTYLAVSTQGYEMKDLIKQFSRPVNNYKKNREES